MGPNDLSESRIRSIRVVSLLFASSSFVLGAWMMTDPAAAWGSVGVEAGPNPFVEALYGGAIMGEGAMFAFCAVWPVRYVVFFQYLVLYKTFACLAGIAVLLQMESPSFGAWSVIAGWALAGVVSALVFPWSGWRRAWGRQGAP